MEFDQQSIISSSSRQHIFERPGSDIKMTGYLKKLKTMKKKYFVLRCTSSSGPARLEYYDSEKKFKSGTLPKRSILLHTCFNINKKSDSRQKKHGIALYTNDECFTILTESEKEQEAWLSVILEFQNEYLPDGDMHKEHYEYVWQVTLQARGLGQGKGTKGQYRLCLNSNTVSLVKTNSNQPQFTIQLVTIRSVAHHENSFRLEVGNYAPTGAGEFWFTVEDSNIAKDMHETLLHYMNATEKGPTLRRDQQTIHLRSKRDSQAQSVTYCPNSPLDAHSPGSPNYPIEYPGGGHRLRSDSRASHTSKASFHEDTSPGFLMNYNGEHLDTQMREHYNVVPPDMSPPPSPCCLDDQISAYLAMDMEKSKQRSSVTSVTSTSSQSSSYLSMGGDNHGTSHKGEISSSHQDVPSTAYMSMAAHHDLPASHPIPIHVHSYSEPMHSSHLPTVKEGGSNEGYLPMDMPSSPASSSGMPRPEPAACLLSDSSTGLPPRTYSLGSKPTKKLSSYIEMGPQKGGGNDMSRATSAPHILKGRRDREHRTESPTPSASPLSTSVKSDDSDSFMEYMPMRPRTASDSFNCRNRTSSFGKMQPTCRPRSSSHGQGTRPVINFNKLGVEKARTSQEPLQRISRESSLQGSFDSLHISNESLRRLSQDMRQASGSNASDYAEMRGTPSPQMKSMKSDTDSYISMQVGTGGRRTSPHRVRTDSTGSGRYPDVKTKSSDCLHHQPHLQQISDYQEMAPLNTGGSITRDSYMNMDYNIRHSDSKSSPSASLVHSSHQEDLSYINMDLDDKSKKSDGNRSLSMENVDTYILFNPQNGNKPRTGSLGSKDKTISRPVSTRKSSSASVSSASSPSSSGFFHPQNQPTVSSSNRAGGSSDSIKKTSRQSSMEKYGSLGKDFRKKSGSTGSRPNTGKVMFGGNLGKDHHHHHVPGTGRKSSATKLPESDPGDDEYIEFSPTATKGNNNHQPHRQANVPLSGQSHSNMSLSGSGRNGPFGSSGSFSSTRSNPTPSPAEDDAYTLYSPNTSSTTKSVHFQQQEHHSHHQPPQSQKPASSPSSTQVKPIAAKDKPEYVGFEPGNIHNSSHVSTHPFSNIKQVEAKDTPQYVGFEPGIKPFSTTSVPQSNHSHPKGVSPKNQEEYVGFEPGTSSYQPHKVVSPGSAVSYIQRSEETGQVGFSKPKQQDVKQHRKSLDSTPKMIKNNLCSTNKSPELPTSFIFDTPGQTVRSSSVSPSQMPPVPPIPVSTAISQQGQGIAKPVAQDGNDYLTFSPAELANPKVSQNNSETFHDKTGELNTKSQLKQLFIDVGEEPNTSPGVLPSGSSPRNQKKQKLQQHSSPQSFLRQLSAPASHVSPVGKLLPAESQIQSDSPLPISPDNLGSSRHKHLSSSSLVDSPSPTGSSSRHKHCSGSSSSSQKSRKSSSDSERTTRKGNKSDSTGKNRRRIPSGAKSPDVYQEEISGSHKNEVFLPMGMSSLEAKIIPVEAKIRHSLGDVTSSASKVNKDGLGRHGMIRPDSTPCIKNLAPCLDPGSRSVGDTPNSTPRSGSVQFTVGPRSRHSLSDLGAYQQMNFTSPTLATLGSEHKNSPGSKGIGSNAGLNETSIGDQPSKPLNYVKLDLSCPEGQGDPDGKPSRVKSRNSSDADERQPPLSYAEIDFVKSQSRNKALSAGISADNSSKS